MTHISKWHLLGVSVAATLVASCGGGGGGGGSQDRELRALISQHGLSGDPATGRSIAPLSDPLPQLGKLLYFSKAISADMEVACVTCHHPTFGGGDELPIPVGVDPVDPDLFGPGRTRVFKGEAQTPAYGIGDSPMPRNSPTVFGLAFWDKSVTWDGTVFSEAGTVGTSGTDSRLVAPTDTPPVSGMQTKPGINTDNAIPYEQKYDAGMNLGAGHGLFPSTVAPAMRGGAFPGYTGLAVRQRIAARIGNYGEGTGELASNNWEALFRTAFNDQTSPVESVVTANNISKAIASFEYSMTFTNSPWKAYVQGDDKAISDAAKRGAELFFKPVADGGGNCASCHSGDFFTDEQYWVLAVPQVGRGKGNKNSDTDTNDDWGRANVTGEDEDKWAFRTPTLLNIEVTGPYGHTGVFPTLEGIVRHHLNVEASLASFDYNNLSQDGGPINTANAVEHTALALQRLKDQRATGLEGVQQDVALNDSQVADLVAFLKTLTDPCTKDRACLDKWLPGATDPDPDGQRIKPKDRNGNLL